MVFLSFPLDTLPLGTGIVCTGIKKRVAKPEEEAFATASMVALNDVAGGLLTRFGAHACTVTAKTCLNLALPPSAALKMAYRIPLTTTSTTGKMINI